jgi:uncharacterized protein (UPF0332 family)
MKAIKDLEREGLIKKLPIDQKKVKNAFNLAKRDLEFVMKIKEENFDWTFAIAYNSMLQASRALMFFHGYRPTESKSHISVIKFVEIILGNEFRKEITTFDRVRRKRHSVIYDEAGSISSFEANFAVKSAEKFLKEIKKRLTANGF